MSFIPENISNFNLICVLKLSWKSMNKEALPRSFHALSFRLKGNGIFSVKGKPEMKASDSDIIFVPHNLGYQLTAKDESLYCVHFTADNLPSDNIYVFSPAEKKTFEKLFTEMYSTWSEKKAGYHNKTASYLFTILSKMQSAPSTYTNEFICSALDYIHEHFTSPALSVRQLAKISSMSESFFRKEFKNVTGISPLQYINDLRITRALELLESGYYKIYEIAEKSGFSDSKYFSTVIKKATGQNPKEFLHKQN